MRRELPIERRRLLERRSDWDPSESGSFASGESTLEAKR